MMSIDEYLKEVIKRFQAGISTEHTYRGDLQNLLQVLVKGISVTNEPKRQKCGAPDYIIQRNKVPIGYIEAKDIGIDLNKIEKSEQLKRYKKSLDNLILTDYLEFRFIKYGQKVTTVKIGEMVNGKINTLSNNFESLVVHIEDFCSFNGQTIKSSEKLAKMMAQKARMMEEVLYNALIESGGNGTLNEQFLAFKKILIHELSEKEFADIYAQTIAYGLFAARLHDESLENFSREEALFLIPKTNPFLRQLFSYVAGPDLDDRVVWIVNDLADIFRATDIKALLKNFGKATQQTDPFIHFYETFLGEYNPKLRKSRGVYYTPEPVVNFIVRAVDDILKTEFNLPQGLADTAKTKIKVKTQTKDNRTTSGFKEVERDVHKVQILDPATGTGTFLAEVVKHIYKKYFKSMQGAWSSYVEEHLVPRLNGFELLMASYSMAHLKLEMLLRETGYKTEKDQRLNIFLTNSLEEYHPDTGTMWAGWLSNEANEANHIKRDSPVMVMLGNPPYSVSSSNKGEWIQNLLKDYKKGLQEKKINLDDDYIKFIRYGQYLITKNGEGILAYITNNSFIDGITHRQMRKELSEIFDKIYILDLHGFAKLKGIDLVADKDENVFDIQQGVSINIFIKHKSKSIKTKSLIRYFEQYGTREEKYAVLSKSTLNSIKWKQIKPTKPYFFFVEKDFTEKKSHEKGFKINDIFIKANSGVKTDRDKLFYDTNITTLKNRFKTLLGANFDSSFSDQYNIKDSGSYKITSEIVNKKYDDINIQPCAYRPFDLNWIYYDPKLISRPAHKSMSHFNRHENIGLILGRQGQVVGHMQWNLIFCTKSLTDYNIFYRGGGYVFPLYLYTENPEQQSITYKKERIPNLNLKIIDKIAKELDLTFTNEKEKSNDTLAPIDILNYIYAVLHSQKYRSKYREFLKIDFPRIPYPKTRDTFRKLVKLGGELQQFHLLESSKTENHITSFPKDGDNIISRKINKNDWQITNAKKNIGRIWINDQQYFDKVPLVTWEFFIGGYQPVQKWLKDRKGQVLSFDDINHYQNIIVALNETDRIMKEIDKVIKL